MFSLLPILLLPQSQALNLFTVATNLQNVLSIFLALAEIFTHFPPALPLEPCKSFTKCFFCAQHKHFSQPQWQFVLFVGILGIIGRNRHTQQIHSYTHTGTYVVAVSGVFYLCNNYAARSVLKLVCCSSIDSMRQARKAQREHSTHTYTHAQGEVHAGKGK